MSSLEGVEKADVDFGSKSVTIVMKAEKSLTKETLDKAFEGGKFSITSFEEVKEEKKEEKQDEKKKEKKEDPKKSD